MENEAPDPTPVFFEYSKADKESLGLIYLDHIKELPLYISRNTLEASLISADIKSLEHAPPIDWVLILTLTLSFYVGFDYVFDLPDPETPQVSTKVVFVEEETQNKKRKRNMEHRSKKEKPQPLDPLNVSPMFWDDETNTVVAAYKSVITYSLYKNDDLFVEYFSF